MPADDYDYWCENRAVCGRQISPFIAEVKGNAGYGIGSRVLGTFDVVWRQNFNGPYARWRLLLIWDSGPAVDSDFWKAQVRKELDFRPDSTIGSAQFRPAAISSIGWRAWSPSSTGLTQNSKKVASAGTFHDDGYGYFFAAGCSWSAATLHTGHWRSTKKGGFYQQRYSKVPY